jgi:hypothetical protein
MDGIPKRLLFVSVCSAEHISRIWLPLLADVQHIPDGSSGNDVSLKFMTYSWMCWRLSHKFTSPLYLHFAHILEFPLPFPKSTWVDRISSDIPRAIYTNRAALVGEVSANVCGKRVPRRQRDGSLRPYSRLSRPEPLMFLQSCSSVVLTSLSEPCSRATTSQKILVAAEIEPGPLDQ